MAPLLHRLAETASGVVRRTLPPQPLNPAETFGPRRSYTPVSEADIRERITSDLSRAGTVENIEGSIICVDGQWELSGVRAVVSGRLVWCHKDAETHTISYKTRGKPFRLEAFPVGYARGDEETPLPDLLNESYQKVYGGEVYSDYLKAYSQKHDLPEPLIAFRKDWMLALPLLILVGALIFFALSDLVNSSLIGGLVAGFVVVALPVFDASIFIRSAIVRRKLVQLENQLNLPDVLAQHYSEVERDIVRLCRAHNYTYHGSIKIHDRTLYTGSADLDNMILSFDMTSNDSEIQHVHRGYTDGFALWFNHNLIRHQSEVVSNLTPTY